MMNIVKLISDKLNSSIENKGSGSLVVSGGSSPISIYEELSNYLTTYENHKDLARHP